MLILISLNYLMLRNLKLLIMDGLGAIIVWKILDMLVGIIWEEQLIFGEIVLNSDMEIVQLIHLFSGSLWPPMFKRWPKSLMVLDLIILILHQFMFVNIYYRLLDRRIQIYLLWPNFLLILLHLTKCFVKNWIWMR